MRKEPQPFNKELYDESPRLWEVTTVKLKKPVRILCTDAHSEKYPDYPVIGLVDGRPHTYTKDGEEDMLCFHFQDNLQMQWDDELPAINVLTEELAQKYDGKCYVDYDDNYRIEAVHFFKDDKGLNAHYVCTDGLQVLYNYTDVDEINTEGMENAYSLSYINMIEENCHLLKEITKEKFDEIVAIVDSCKDFSDQRTDWIRTKQKELGIYPENYL
jgi:hypothetical protein